MLFPALTAYAWAAGHNVALNSLRNVENDVNPYNRRTTNDAYRRVAIASQPVDMFPVRSMLLSQRERGDGMVTHEWVMTLGTLGIKYILDTYLSSGTVVSAPMTIYTRRHELAAFARFNCNLTLPKPKEDIEYLRHNVFRVTWRFTGLEAL